jgi:tRNA uridine 5-carbamoylmethylation protein Kti12
MGPKKKNRVIIIKGSPGVGKSYISMKLASKIKNKKLAVIPVDFVLHLDQGKLNENKLKLAKVNTAIIVNSFLRERYDVIIDYTFDKISHLEFLIEKIVQDSLVYKSIPKITVIHLTAPFKEVRMRNENRLDGTDPVPENTLVKLYKKCENTISLIPGEEVIDISKYSAKQIVNIILKIADED